MNSIILFIENIISLLPKEKDQLKVFKNIQNDLKKRYGWDTFPVKFINSNKCLDNSGKIINNRNHNLCGGSYLSNLKTISIGDNEHLKIVKKEYNIKMQNRKFLKLIITHELLHYVYQNLLTSKDKKWYKDMLDQGGFTTKYLEKLDKVTDEEKFCEYIATTLYG